MNLTMKREFNAPCSMVFKAWTESEALNQWFSPSGRWSMSVTALDVRVGGNYRFELKSPDGADWIVFGTYKEIIPNKKIVFSWSTEDVTDTLVTIEFHDQGKTTEVLLTHDLLPNQEQVDEHNWGWEGCMDNLATKMFC